MRHACRNCHRERAALPKRALDPHTAAMEFDQFLNKRQADPGAFVRPGVGTLDAMKALEYPLLVFRWDSHARVADLQFHGTLQRLQRKDSLALERELQRVREKI